MWLFLAASGCSAPHDSGTSPDISLAEPPDGWVQTPERCGVRFWGPPDMVEVAVQGVDSCVFQFRTSSCDFGGDVGGFSGPVTQNEGELDFQVSAVRIDGREGALAQFQFPEGSSQPYVATLRVPLPSPAGWNSAAALYATCSSAEARDEALLAIRTATIQADD